MGCALVGGCSLYIEEEGGSQWWIQGSGRGCRQGRALEGRKGAGSSIRDRDQGTKEGVSN